MTGNLFSRFAPAIRRNPAKTAITFEDRPGMSFGELDAWSGRLAAAMTSAGLVQGDRVLVQIGKSPMAIALHLACLRAGLIYVSLNTAYTPAEMAYFLKDSGAALIVCDPAAEPSLREVVSGAGVNCRVETLDAAGEGTLSVAAQALPAEFADIVLSGTDVAAVLYTSGTTGKPKGAMLTHANLLAGVTTISSFWGFSQDDVLLHPLPIFHAHGLFIAAHSALLHGCTMHFVTRFSTARVIDLLPRSTVMMGVPTMYSRLVEDPNFTREVCASMRLFTCGSAALPTVLFERFEAITGHRLLERYGATETLLCTSNPLHGVRKPGTVGIPLPGVDVRVVDDADQPVAEGSIGNVQARGPNIFVGYWGRPEATAADFTADGFFRQGDLGVFDSDGYLSIVGRSKDLIISGGYNVYPIEIEALLETLDGISEAAVFGVPHPDFGEAVVAAIVASPAVSDAEIIETARKQLAVFKLPKALIRVSSLPRNAMGKVIKPDLRREYAEIFVSKT